MITKIAHSAIKVKNIENTLKFYSDILGFKESFRIYNDDGSLSIVYLYIAQGQFIEIFPYGEGEYLYDASAVGHSHMCYEVDNIEEAIRKVRSKGVNIESEIKKGKSGAFQFWILDPDGNRIEIMELPPDSMQAKANKIFEGK
jgi:lactoylglutathione lyase